jgi:serine/threonine protein kinase/tetratricopeptide (TPR) repeat protein
VSGAEHPSGERPNEEHDAADLRMADVLRGSSSGADLRKELADDTTAAASDLRARLDALDFVQQVVGNPTDVPARIGAYKVKGVLGRGGMGTVYLGWQEDLEREVALKVLSPGFSSDPTMRKRFRAEARATAALHHRHIVPIYDYGEAGGVLFFAMERVHGMSLDKHIAAARRVDRVPLDPLDAARRFAGVADALGLAHRRRLLHRDVKPGNILVGQDGTLALTDFGLAKALDHASMRLTSKGGGFLGTLHYSSPEQALGRELTPASDLYSLGVTIFEALTGELPLAGKTTEALLQSILHGTPRRLRDVIQKPPRDLEAVVDKLLAREPGDRYQDGEGLARDLQRIADGEPVHIRRLPLHTRLWRRMRKNPVLSGAIAAAAVLLLVTFTLLLVLRRERGQGSVLRHQEHLVAVAKRIAADRGAPGGPTALLACLTGVAAPAQPPNPEIVQELQRAAKDQPDDPQAPQMLAAFVEDPARTATGFLAEGRGYEALGELDRAIATAEAARLAGDLAIELQLHRLYLARGVANLTAAVGRATEARTDLALASYLRPGAMFAASLLDVLDVVQASDFSLALGRLQRDRAQAAPDRLRVLGTLLWAAAGLRPQAKANLMDFGLTFPQRRDLHQLAQRWLPEPPSDCVRQGQPTGLSAILATACGDALRRLSDAEAVRQIAGSTATVIDAAVHPDSPLQGWRFVLQMLQTERAVLVDRDQKPLPPMLQLAAWDDLLRLSPPRRTLETLLRRFEELRQANPGLPGIARVSAWLHLRAHSPETSRFVQAWVVDSQGDPDAWLCRLRLQLRTGEFEAACDDAMVAVQNTADPDAVLGEVAQCCLEAAAESTPGHTEQVRLLAQRFQALKARREAQGGGR